MVDFPEQTPEERAYGDAFWAAWTKRQALYYSHQADQFRARLHAAIAAGVALGSACTCGAPDCQFRGAQPREES